VSQEVLEWIGRASRGDAEAVERLLELHLPAVRAFVRAHMSPKLRARESSSDVVQSVCREILSRLDQLQHPGEDAFRAWLFTTARRKLANRARDLGREKRDAAREHLGEFRESALAALGATYSRISSPTGQALKKEEIERLEAAIDRLSDPHREVLTLAYFAELSRAEIGAQLGKTEEAVRALLHRATARLAMLMAGD
jgi:RNA polymerase sigma-70 factor (subfamily 1)